MQDTIKTAEQNAKLSIEAWKNSLPSIQELSSTYFDLKEKYDKDPISLASGGIGEQMLNYISYLIQGIIESKQRAELVILSQNNFNLAVSLNKGGKEDEDKDE